VKRLLLCGSVLLVSTAWAQDTRPEAPVDCDDNYAECKEDCTISYGGTTNDKVKAKINTCMRKCNSVEADCRERFFETRRNNLDEGSLKDSPSSRSEDSDGMPKSAPKKKSDEGRTKISDSSPPPKAREEDLSRDDPPPAKAEKKRAEPQELKPEETPKSSRTQISEKPAPKAEPKPEPRRVEEPARREEPKKSAGLDSDVRSEDDAPRKAEKKHDADTKKDDTRKEENKKKKDRALDEWDPDAI